MLGGGTMGLGITQALALSGVEVVLIGANAQRARRAFARLEERTRSQVETGLRPLEHMRILDRVVATGELATAVADVQLVIESVPENLELKCELLKACARHAPPEVVLATNTSSFPISRLAQAVPRPERFLGLHWFNPPEWVPGVEIIPSSQTDETVVTACRGLLTTLGKEPVLVGDSPGFVANRLQYALLREALACVDEGIATPLEIDRTVRSCFGFRLPFFGPFQIADMAGLDIYLNVFQTLRDNLGDAFAPPAVLEDLVAQGRLGTKTGQGFYQWPDAERPGLLANRDRKYARLARLLAEERDDT
ncbi:MAG: 3-hydroxyacyl-CoA dehydrogenase family protein [Egibacteraceae bacterium]